MTTTTENFGWVIEGAWSHVTKPDYWQGSSAWGQDPDLALRFARKRDAQQAADLMLDGINVRICEHQWAEVVSGPENTGLRQGTSREGT